MISKYDKCLTQKSYEMNLCVKKADDIESICTAGCREVTLEINA